MKRLDTIKTGLLADRISPTWSADVPFCSDEQCARYDGKRCDAMGHRPGNICEPAVSRMGGALTTAASWLILCTDEPGHGGVGLWWNPEGAGYTRDLDKAGRWTEEEAKRRAGDRDMALSLAAVEPRAHRVVELDKIDGAWSAIHARRARPGGPESPPVCASCHSCGAMFIPNDPDESAPHATLCGACA